MSGDRPEGLKAPSPDRPGRDDALEFPRMPAQALAIHRDRRLKVAVALLAASLALGGLWTYDFYAFSREPGVPVGDFGGLVIDANDSPVADADVSIEGTALNTTTSQDGTFLLHGVPSGRITLTVRKAGFVTSSFTVFAVPTAPGAPLVRSEILQVEAGTGTHFEDVAAQRDAWATVCTSVLVIGNVLNLLGLVAVAGRRRYRHAMLGGIGAIVSFGWIVGALFGFIAMFLIMGARDEFKDRGSLFATEHDMPFPRAEGSDERPDGDGGPPEGGPDPGEGAPGTPGDREGASQPEEASP